MQDLQERHLNLALASVHGDSTAFCTLFELYRPHLMSTALCICGQLANAKDCVQDTFISAFTHVHSLRDAERIYPWLKKILENHCYMSIRKARFLAFDDSLAENSHLLEESIEKNFEHHADLQVMWHAVSHLSEELRSCILLRYFSSVRNYEDIATVLAVPVGTVRSRLNAARKKLNEIFLVTPDSSDTCVREALEWSDYYTTAWNQMHHDSTVRSQFLLHLHPQMNIRFTSGKYGIGRSILEKELDEDLTYGSSLIVNEVISSGSISIIEANNINSKEHPDRCPPSMTFVAFRKANLMQAAHIFETSRIA